MRIARELIDPDADKVVRRLARHGHKAYLVGGCVRDLLLGRDPKDFDVSTSATPKEIKQLFRNCRIIGRRFRLAHIFFGGKIIETSTFRANPREGEDESAAELLIRRDNVFGTALEDAQRRDFRINGLFYDVEAETVIDHVDGLEDLGARIISTIGNPNIRFREDPVRMMRAIKFAARMGFTIGPATYAALRRHGGEIRKCAAPRVLEELYRLLKAGSSRRSLELLVESGLAGTLSERLALMFRETETARADDEAAWAATWDEEPAQEVDAQEVDDEIVAQEVGAREIDDETGAPNNVLPLQPEPFSLPWLGDREVAARRAVGWRMLEANDALVSGGRETSSSLVVALLCCPFVAPELVGEEMRPSEASELVSDLLFPLTEELGIARRDSERAKQILWLCADSRQANVGAANRWRWSDVTISAMPSPSTECGRASRAAIFRSSTTGPSLPSMRARVTEAIGHPARDEGGEAGDGGGGPLSRQTPKRRASHSMKKPSKVEPDFFALIDVGARDHYEDSVLYDYEYRRRRADANFYKKLAEDILPNRDQPVLELACGSGRVTSALLRGGHQVIGLDLSASMLEKARGRIAKMGRAHKERATLARSDMRRFALGIKVPLIVSAFNSFEHLYTRTDVEATLDCARTH